MLYFCDNRANWQNNMNISIRSIHEVVMFYFNNCALETRVSNQLTIIPLDSVNI